jgi:hypothetical protein
MSLDEKIRTIGINSDARKIRLVANPSKPAVKFHQIEISPEKTRNNNDAGGVTAGNAQSVIDGRGMEEENFRRK